MKLIHIVGIALLVLTVFIVGCASEVTTSLTSDSAAATTLATEASYTLAEVAQHASSTDCWMVIDDVVYDVTDYIASGQHHPEIVDGCGLDATVMFDAERKHSSPKAESLLTQMEIGVLSE